MPGPVIGGTFCIAHSGLLKAALTSHGFRCISDHTLADPFALLLHRIQNPDAVVLTTLTDTIVHPEVRKLLFDLASILLPGGLRTILRLDVDPHELFYHLVQTGYHGTFSDMLTMDTVPIYSDEPSGDRVPCVRVPPFAQSTPTMLAQIVESTMTAIKGCEYVESSQVIV